MTHPKKPATKKVDASKKKITKPAVKKPAAAKKPAAPKKTESAAKPAVKKTTASVSKPAAAAPKNAAKKAEGAARPAVKKIMVKKIEPAVKPQVSAPAATQPIPVPQPQPSQPKPIEPAKPAAAPVVKPSAPAPIAQPKPVEQPAQPQQPAARPVQQPKPVEPAKPAAAAPSAPALKTIKILGSPTIKELAEKMNIKINDFIKKLMGMGIFATINQRLEGDMVELVLHEFGFKAEITEEFAKDKITEASEAADKPEDLKPRPPVVTIMGHVDHGKTSLLDAIRQSNVAGGEFGAITQHIGAYTVKTSRGQISFLDTPGHEAFTAMRARGAQATDIVILVVSATDGIMPQTIEAINHAQSAKAPIIVAVNKIDLPGANPEKVRLELANRGLTPEEWQGNTIYVDISAKKRVNIDKLLEMISLQAEMMELKANPDRPGSGVILESRRDNKRGVVATVLVQKGTMRVGDPFIVGNTYGKIRALIDEHGKRLAAAGPGIPAEILGVSGEPPAVGDTLFITESEKEAKYIAEKRKLAHKEEKLAHQKHLSLSTLRSEVDGRKIKELPIILKADVHGSIEAIKDAILRTPTEEVEVKIIHSGAGNVNESDLLLAKAGDAVILAFNVDTDASVADAAERDGIEIRKYNIIFELLEDLHAAMEGLLEPDVVEETVGRATVRQIFDLSSGFVAGSYIDEGKLVRGYEVKILRGGAQIYKGRISGLKRFKDDVKEVEKGYECGVLVEGFRQTKTGDVIECFQKKTIVRRIKKQS
ncbi:MAG: translation initiation factor IF-2 [Elusimicrobiota bacterium]|jgi:translation initiation factor IF-2|nr:translation initiation factor IF-2 [Elusimicrobiota bacterium]